MRKYKKNIVVKSNELNQYTFYKSVIQLKIFNELILKIRDREFNDNTNSSNIYRLYIKDFFDDFVESKENYTTLKRLCKKMGQMIEFPQKKGFCLKALFYEIKTKEKGFIDFVINPSLKPFLVNLSEKFSYYNNEYTRKLDSLYSFRIYELLKQYESKTDVQDWWVISINELRDILEIEPTLYSRYNDFKRFVLLKAQKELKEKTDIQFEFEELKEGRKITQIKFYIYTNNSTLKLKSKKVNMSTKLPNNQNIIIDDNPLIQELISYGVDRDNAIELVKNYSIEVIKNNIHYFKKELESGTKIPKKGGFLRSAIEKNYAKNNNIFNFESKKEKEVKKEIKTQKENEIIDKLKKEFDKKNNAELKEFLDENVDNLKTYLDNYFIDNPKAKNSMFDDTEALLYKTDRYIIDNINNINFIKFKIYLIDRYISNDFIKFSKIKGFNLKAQKDPYSKDNIIYKII